MKYKFTIPFALSALSLFIVISGFSQIATAAERSKPNVVIIYGDDVGFGDVGVYGGTLIPPPQPARLRVILCLSACMAFAMMSASLHQKRHCLFQQKS